MYERTGHWITLAPGVFARRYDELDQTLGLVVGSHRCLVIDTGTDEVHGAELAAAVREHTDLPWTVVLTHAHFDHYFGTTAFAPCPVWAHERCHPALLRDAEHDRAVWARHYRQENKPGLAAALDRARLVLPDRLLTERTTLDLGDRSVHLLHPGPGHTDHDVAVHVPDAGVLFAGDLVEQGTPPVVGQDSDTTNWPSALNHLLTLEPHTIVPGHGDPVDPAFVRAQRAQIEAWND